MQYTLTTPNVLESVRRPTETSNVEQQCCQMLTVIDILFLQGVEKDAAARRNNTDLKQSVHITNW
jgi:hypothetical protein